ncbi:hypothetical protein [Mesorhizobium sp. KR9-304]|uniref:hypothetical protein n=1 Tax=Mesorhizobium sp. KR9-304 TaxID=3156614 RepID=UPI0032B4BB0A
MKRLSDAEDLVASSPGWERKAIHAIDGDNFLEASIGDVRVNFFESAIYDNGDAPKQDGFLHASFAVSDLSAMLENSQWKATLIHGPTTIKGGFGHRRIAFFEPLPGCRIELMEELGD